MVVPDALRAKWSAIARPAKVALLLGLLSVAASCARNDPRFRYDKNNPLDEAIYSASSSTERAVESVMATVRDLIGDERTPEAVRRALSARGAACREIDAVVRCTYAKARGVGIPSPIPFVGVRWEEFYDFDIEARRVRAGTVRISVCVSRFGGIHARDEAKARKEEPERDCKIVTLDRKAPPSRN